jgi:outer membrane protein OmpA-like peptidoglycan-associated protein
MEKINDCKINLMMNISILIKTVCVFLLAGFCISPPVKAQIRAGSGYLKMLTGAREVGLSGTLTAALDHSYSFYVNPAATGFAREWQWSATYTKWISDLYNASFLYGMKIHTPWSHLTKFMVGVNYLGIPEFNNVSEITTSVPGTPISGNNLLLTASVAQPLSLISANISLGANIKYFNSELAEFKADAFIFDLGLLYRTPRYDFLKPVNGILDYIIFAGGLSITNMGNAIVFISEETPLPHTVRAGIAANIGSHHGMQFSLASDYRLVRDEDGYFTFGSEISWRQLVSLRLGYSWENNLLGNFAFGGTIRLDDRIMNSTFVGRNKALRLDLAANQNNDFFASPYHGSITHQPIGPERFNLLSPAYDEKITSDSVTLKWEVTTDPDLFDDIEHWLVVDQDSNQLASVKRMVDNNEDSLLLFLKGADFLVNQKTIQNQFVITELAAGNYFWTVLACDTDHHLRLAKMNHHEIAKFQVTAPDPRVIALDFDYSPWITEDDCQGVLRVSISNLGNRAAKNFSLLISDSLVNSQSELNIKNFIATQTLPTIEPREVVKIELEWRTKHPGLHDIRAEIASSKRTVNQYSQTCYTIPKGVFSTDDTVVVQENFHFIYDLPYIGKIFFDSSSAEVKASYINNWVIEPPLIVFAKRLLENPMIKIKLQGTIDPNSDEQNINLANQRAMAVRDSLHRLGVSLDQMEILPGNKLEPRRVTRITTDTKWILEERRRVDITTDPEFEESLFQPLETTYVEKTILPIPFQSKINGVVPLVAARIKLTSSDHTDSLNINEFLKSASLIKNIDWLLTSTDTINIDDWLQKQVTYSLVLTDTLNRRFQVRPKDTYLEEEVSGRQRKYYILANFAQASPFYSFYWSNLLKAIPIFLEDKNILICFQGHGCAIGSDRINLVLSKQRASTFMEKFLQDIQEYYPELYDDVKQRTDLPQGFGESEPLAFKTLEGKVVFLGDNSTPLGRQMNRRVMVCFSPRGK